MIKLTWLLLIGISVGSLVWIALRRGWVFAGSRSQSAGAFLPDSAPRAAGAARLVEAVVLGFVGAIFVVLMSRRSGVYDYYGGNLGEMVPDYSILHVVLFGCALGLAGLAILVVLSGRTPAGATLMGLMLIGYGIVIFRTNERFPPRQTIEPVNTIDVADAHVTGADLWVNGVYLGKTPYTTTASDFEAKVPYWSKLPAEYEKEKVETVRYGPRGSWPDVRDRWMKFSMMLKPSVSDRSNTAIYYAKVRYAGEWGSYLGSSGGGGSSEYFQTSFQVTFRERQKRLETLLNMARLAQYHVGPAWFQAAETYHGDVWLALGKGVEQEPQMAEVRDAWATWQYGLDKVSDADSAWAAFQKICSEADTQQEYLTDSVAGRAVELLVPKLPQDMLVSRAVQLIRDWSAFGTSSWHNNGRLQFGRRRPAAESVDISYFAGFRVASGKPSKFPASGFAVAHAVWMLDEQFRATGQPEPNIIQQRVVPEIVRRHGNGFDSQLMLLASRLGGPALDKFLLRQKWGAPSDAAHFGDFTYVSGRPVNKWLYYLAYLDDEAGHTFRREHARLLMDMADTLCENNSTGWSDDIGFIFSDHELATDYWPRFFRGGPKGIVNEPLKTRWRYLSMMGDAATVQMFVEAWKGTQLSLGDYRFALGEIDSLRPPMQRKVVEAIARLIRDDAGRLVEVLTMWGRDNPEAKDRMIADLESHDRVGFQLSEAKQLWADLQKGPSTDQQSLRKSVPLWLAHTQTDSPLVAMLANSAKPELRLMAIGAFQKYPIPRNQELLEKLLKDPNATVRTAAEKASGELQKLAARKPAEFVSDAASELSTPSTTSTSDENN